MAPSPSVSSLWNSRMRRFGEDAVRVAHPDPCVQRPDRESFGHELPFIGVAAEALGFFCGGASDEDGVLHTNEPQTVSGLNVVERLRLRRIEITVDEREVH